MLDLEDLRQRVDSVVWYHTLDLGHGIITDGYCKTYLEGPQLPHFRGQRVLDIGAWDGYYSFLAEREGASEVVALDHYVWGVDFGLRNPYWMECHENGVLPDQRRDTTDFWNSDLPGMRGFNLAREAVGSKVEPVVGDFTEIDLAPLGRFDVVLFLGVLYHLKEPLAALERIRQLTDGVAVIETEALLLPGREPRSVLEFTAGCYRGFDYSNWFTPTIEALHELCRAAGFTYVRTITGPPPAPAPPTLSTTQRVWQAARRRPVEPAAAGGPTHYRAVVHARP
jgi:tRNA (mo5U34)-methyltransferase